MPWINVSKDPDNKSRTNAIVFVHGLNGKSKSWRDETNRFVDRLRNEPSVGDHFGLYIYEYPAKIIEFSFIKKLLSIIPGIKKERFNISIRKIALTLKSNMDEILRDCPAIILVAHSMGGLVAKKALVEMQEENVKRIRLFLSLSVPHHGSLLANTGSLLIQNNSQINDLRSFSEFTNELTTSFSRLKDKPEVICQAGHQDLVVNEGAAMPADIDINHRIYTDDDHYSVLQISDPANHLPYLRLVRELKNILVLNQQQSVCSRANDEVSFTIPAHWSFAHVANELVATANCTIEFIGFSEDEKKVPLKPQELMTPNTYQALISLQFIGQSPIPPYHVEIKDCHFKIIKKDVS